MVIGVIVLFDSQIDYIIGLFSLCEGCLYEVWCMQMVYQDFSEGFLLFFMFFYWNGGLCYWLIVFDGEFFVILVCLCLCFIVIFLCSSVLLYFLYCGDFYLGDNIGLFVEDFDSVGILFYVLGFGEVDEVLFEWMCCVDCLLVDGMFWCDDEMLVCEVGDKFGWQMGYLVQSGLGGMFEVLVKVLVVCKVFIYINNINFIFDIVLVECVELDVSGIEVVWDGMYIQLQGVNMSCVVMDCVEFEWVLCDKGCYYYIYYLFYVVMYEGCVSCEQIQGWVVNCFYYQVNILLKDVVILVNCFDCEVCCEWIQCIFDYDGVFGEVGGIEVWLCLVEVVGLECEQVFFEEWVLFGVCFVVDVYVNFVCCVSWQEVVSSLLIEFFVLQIYQLWLDSWLCYYLWIEVVGYEYFCSCLVQVWCDVEYGLWIILEYYWICEVQECMLDIL